MHICVRLIYERNIAVGIEPIAQSLDGYVRAAQPENALFCDSLLVFQIL